MVDSSHGGLKPLNYLKIFFRRKEMILIPAFIGLVIGICAGIVLPKKYESATTLLVEEGKTDNPLFSRLAVSTTVVQRMSNIKESMLGWNSLVKLVKRLNMDRDVKSSHELENLILKIREDITITLKGPNIISLSYLGEDPEQTQAVVQNITDIFIQRNKEIQDQETSDAIAFIEEQLKVYRGKIKSAEIAGLKDKLQTLLIDSTEEHPRVKQLRDQIDQKEAELKAENLEYTENATLESKVTNPIIKEIQAALNTIEGSAEEPILDLNTDIAPQESYYKLLLADKLDKVMARDKGVNDSIYNELLQRLETAKITQRLQASKEGTKYTVLDPPRLPLRPVKPNKILVALGGLFVGVIFGACLVFLSEFLDKSFIDVEDASNFFGTPLLGAISKIHTEASIRKNREEHAWFYSLSVIAGIVVIILTSAIHNFLK
ncbi:MAG: hypothetical protein KC713_09670 [Candidatus Omnitrophica bacterium]|nr:hypothetical protein [Candidatus Omnitrophota bacterium]